MTTTTGPDDTLSAAQEDLAYYTRSLRNARNADYFVTGLTVAGALLTLVTTLLAGVEILSPWWGFAAALLTAVGEALRKLGPEKRRISNAQTVFNISSEILDYKARRQAGGDGDPIRLSAAVKAAKKADLKSWRGEMKLRADEVAQRAEDQV